MNITPEHPCGCALPGEESTQSCAWETWRATLRRVAPQDPVAQDDYQGDWSHRDFAGGDCRCSCHAWADDHHGVLDRL